MVAMSPRCGARRWPGVRSFNRAICSTLVLDPYFVRAYASSGSRCSTSSTRAFSLVLALVLGLTVLLHGVSATALVAIAVVWLVPTYLFARLRGRNASL